LLHLRGCKQLQTLKLLSMLTTEQKLLELNDSQII